MLSSALLTISLIVNCSPEQKIPDATFACLAGPNGSCVYDKKKKEEKKQVDSEKKAT